MLTGSYLVRMPKDPQRKDYAPSTRANPGANYFIVRDKTTNRITVSAPGAENGATISVTR